MGGSKTEDELRTALARSQARVREQEKRREDPTYRRNLTDDDVEAIVDALQERVTKQFYQDVGKGVWSMARKAFFIALLGLATYGYFGGHLPK